MEEPICYECDDGIATVTIDAPDARNVLSPPVVDGLLETIATLEDLRCLVLQGAGQTFCAGGAIEGVVQHTSGDLSTDALMDRLERIDELIGRLYALEVPTIAAIDGPAFATGGALALACDLAVASQAGTIGFGFKRLGLAPGGGTTKLLPATVGPSTARELVYTGEMLDAETAVRVGLFDQLYSGEAFQRGIAQLVATIVDAGQPIVTATTRLFDSERHSLEATMQAERDAQRSLLETTAHHERVTAFLDESEFES